MRNLGAKNSSPTLKKPLEHSSPKPLVRHDSIGLPETMLFELFGAHTESHWEFNVIVPCFLTRLARSVPNRRHLSRVFEGAQNVS